MRRLFIILSLIIFTTDTFAACSAGYYEQSVDFTAPTSNPDKYGYYTHDGMYKSNYTSPALSAGQWSATWNSIGIAKGIASCNGTSGSYATTTNSSDSFTNTANGLNCWCKMTEWTPNGGTTQSLAGAWVFNFGYSASFCARYCAPDCASRVRSNSGFRSAVFSAAKASCATCPTGGTSVAGATAITQCYVPTSTTMTDTAGTYHFSSNCYYSN